MAAFDRITTKCIRYLLGSNMVRYIDVESLSIKVEEAILTAQREFIYEDPGEEDEGYDDQRKMDEILIAIGEVFLSDEVYNLAYDGSDDRHTLMGLGLLINDDLAMVLEGR
jgi:hypothetical protein